MNLTSRNITFFCGYPTSDAFNLDRRRYEWDHFYPVKTVQSSHRYNLFHAALAQLQFRLTQFGAGPSQMFALLSRIDQQALFDTVDAYEAGKAEKVLVLVPCFDAVDHDETLTVTDDPKRAHATLAEWDCTYVDLTDFLRGVLAGELCRMEYGQQDFFN